MRAAFPALVLALLAVSVWAAWDDAFPPWRPYARELVDREIAAIEADLAAARAARGQPGFRDELARLDAAIAAAGDAPEPARGGALAAALASVEAAVDSLRDALRAADLRAREPAAAARLDAARARFESAQAAYAAATGAWPPDTTRLARLWAARDSAATAFRAAEGPAVVLRAELDAAGGDAARIRGELARLVAPRDSLEALRRALLDPVDAREARLARLRERPLRVRAIVSADGREVARCPTCHGTLEDPGAHPALPATALLHDVPCTICHGGRGRALDVQHAHRGLLAAPAHGAGPYTLRGRIARLAEADAAGREEILDELRAITGVDPFEEGVAGDAAAAWSTWWASAEAWFEPGDGGLDGEPGALAAAGLDPWRYTARGRPLRYVGSRKCLGCHETLHREHSRRWAATKFRSLERLAGTTDPRPCLPCHATGWDPGTGAYAEPGVTCEGCHGPGERYDEMMVVGQELVGQGRAVEGAALLAHSARLARESISRRLVPEDTGPNNVCVTCHHPRQHRAGCPGILDRNAAGDADGGLP